VVELRGANVVITGAASGIGAAVARRFAAEGTDRLWLADLGDGVDGVADEIGPAATAVRCDVSDEPAVRALVERASSDRPIDLFCANAGIATGQGLDAPDTTWERIWSVNVMAHVYAARACLPGWRAAGRGHLLVTASAAGLLTNLGDAPYTATKHAAVGLAEWIAITHGDEGIGVSCLCPQGVRTPMVMAGLDGDQMAAQVVELMGLIEPEAVADAVVKGLREERFLILPHPEVARYQQNKASDPDRWLAGMRKLQRQLPGH
jgi:NAD(P)-dependent dehydrogenase (short-subunit alcohol dehydrogenase family)